MLDNRDQSKSPEVKGKRDPVTLMTEASQQPEDQRRKEQHLSELARILHSNAAKAVFDKHSAELTALPLGQWADKIKEFQQRESMTESEAA